ncbi:MAG: VOC family protein [Candidatus Abyssobacteria bacterium SURF_17]|uniref:VOC family protein n=1 Tax=Candidatus Abyssobacteria bacterium SURF_17 TaxID=2093361 RepID=A0A419EQM5_9BACT|nr:MAG: VOC family protein [Candidatus Abyssubacteria bacterium SURF_17]
MKARFVHTNLVARDWKRLAEFYQEVFGCTVVPPERDLSGKWLDDITRVPGARIRGAHLRLPGYGSEGPTLEIFQYTPQMERAETAANRPGFAHVAFAVDNVEAARDAVLSAGGKHFGKLVDTEVPGVGRLTVVYVTDPEGNIIELQRWSH